MVQQRLAKFKDKKRAALHARPNNSMASIQYAQDLINLEAGIAVFVGRNGSGKTHFFENVSIPSFANKYYNYVINTSPGACFLYYSPSDRVIKNKKYCSDLLSGSNKQDLIDGQGVLEFEPEIVEYVNYIIGSEFDNILVSQFEDMASDRDGKLVDSFLYVEVSEGGVNRDVSTMSHGELYIIELLWSIRYFSDGYVLLLDEPEIYLYPEAQKRLLNVIFSINNFQLNQILISTHSDILVAELFLFPIIFLSKSIGSNYLISDAKVNNIEIAKLGLIRLPVSVVIFEDVKALNLFKFIIEEVGILHIDDFILLSATQGDGDLIVIGQRAKEYERNKLILCFDGDQRGKVHSSVEMISLVLPGTYAPEMELISAINNAPESFLLQFESCKHQVIGDALRAVRFVNHHDFFIELSRGSGVDEFILLRNAFNSWYAVKANRTACAEFVNAIKLHVGDI